MRSSQTGLGAGVAARNDGVFYDVVSRGGWCCCFFFPGQLSTAGMETDGRCGVGFVTVVVCARDRIMERQWIVGC